MIKKAVQDAFNEQIKYELESAYLYLGMATWFQSEDLDGMAQWMRSQAVEELGHAMRFHNHILDRDGKVSLKSLSIKKTSWKSPLEAFEEALDHEKMITGRIDKLVDLTSKQKDGAGHNFLEWFVEEQIEEESTASKIVADLKRVGDSGHGVLMIDRELGQRQVTMPALGDGEGAE